MADYDAKTGADVESIDYFADPEISNDLPAYLGDMRSRCPVLRERFHGVYMVTGYDAAMEVLHRQADRFSSAVAVTGPIPPLPFAPAGDLRQKLRKHRHEMAWTDHLATMDGIEHAENRNLLTQLLTHKRLKANEDYVGSLVVRLIERIIDRGEAEITKDFAHALSTLVIADLLGVPEDDRDELVDLLGLPPTQMGGDEARKVLSDPLAWLHDRFRGYLLERQMNPQDDMLTELVHSHYRDGSKPPLEVVTRLACFLFGAGQDTSARLVAFCFRVLGEQPDVQAKLRAEPERIPDFIEEVLRMENPVKSVSRLAVDDATIAGVEIPAGSVVTVCVGGANRDPDHFPNPDEIDLDRANKRDHISFSRGPHACVGAPLARMEVRVALEGFLARTKDIRISEAHHGPPGARRYDYEPTYLLSGLQALHVAWDKA